MKMSNIIGGNEGSDVSYTSLDNNLQLSMDQQFVLKSMDYSSIKLEPENGLTSTHDPRKHCKAGYTVAF